MKKSFNVDLRQTFQIASAAVVSMTGGNSVHGFETGGYVYDRFALAVAKLKS